MRVAVKSLVPYQPEINITACAVGCGARIIGGYNGRVANMLSAKTNDFFRLRRNESKQKTQTRLCIEYAAQQHKSIRRSAPSPKTYLDCGTNLIGGHSDHVVDVLSTQAKGFFADLAHRSTIGKHTDLVESDALQTQIGAAVLRRCWESLFFILRVYGWHLCPGSANIFKFRCLIKC